jgi:autotransporter-associated beta strand protein
MIRPWLDRLHRRLFPAGRRRALKPAGRRLGLESLEGRVVPAAFHVTTAADTGPGSLRAAVNGANGSAGSTIDFQLASGTTITLGNTLPAITADATITGPGAGLLTVSGGGKYTVFTVGTSGQSRSPVVTISGLSIAGGNATFGGGIFNWGDLTVTDSTFSGNVADYGGAVYTRPTDAGVGGRLTLTRDAFVGNKAGRPGDFGAGGAVNNFAGGVVTITSSAFTGNSAHYGGAVSNELGRVTVTNSTFTGNQATGKSDSAGGAVINNHAPADPYTISFGSGNTLTLKSCTIAGNTATGTGGGVSSYDYSSSGGQTVTLTNTILAGNTAGASPDIDYTPNASNPGSISATYSLIGNRNGAGSGNLLVSNTNHNLVGTAASPVNPLLAPVGYYGGPTQTMPLLAGSPALGAGGSTPAGDDRGFSRTGLAPDIGAFQTQTLPYQVNAGDDTPSGDTNMGSLTLRDALNLANALAPAGGAAVSFAIPTSSPSYSAATQVFTIHAAAALPIVSAAVNIDATTEAAFLGQTYTRPVIDLSGDVAGGGVNGIEITGANSTVRGLIINSFRGEGVFVHSTYAALAASNGATETGNTVTVTTTAAHGFRVGQPVVVAGVGVAGYNGTFTLLSVPTSTTFTYTASSTGLAASGGGTATGLAANNTIQGNWIGTDVSGSAAAPNIYWGVEIQDAPLTAVGGATAGAGNVISGNGQGGVAIFGGNATCNTVAGNVVGLNAAGTAALGNGYSGILVCGGALFGYTTGSLAGGASGTTVGGPGWAAYNLVGANGERGLWVTGTGGGNVVEGNYLGFNVNGATVPDTLPDLQIDSGASLRLTANSTLKVGTLADAGTLTIDAGSLLDWAGQSGTVSSGTGGIVANGTVKFDSPTGFTVANVISGSGKLTQSGPGTVTLTGNNPFAGLTTVAGGSLVIDGSLAGSVTVAAGTLGGVGSVTGSVVITGYLAPGDGSSATGQLAVGSLSFTAAAPSAVNIDLNGSAAGTGYDQVVATGSVDLTGAALNLSIGFAAPVGAQFVIVDNRGGSAVTGTFTDLAEGQTLTVGGQRFHITYHGGDGNDVVLTRV